MNIVLLKEGETFLSKKDERAEHLRRVLHLKAGDSFKAGIINGPQGLATIERMDDDGVALSFDFNEEMKKLYPLTMIIAQVRPICMKRILREAVSLGAERLILPVSDLGEKSYLNSSLYKSDEYKEILIDGAMQAGSTGVSKCILTNGIKEAIERLPEGERFLLDNVVGAEALSKLNLEGRHVILAIGPERGWSDRERRVFVENGFKPVLLGSRILRTETAAVSGAAIALSRMGFL